MCNTCETANENIPVPVENGHRPLRPTFALQWHITDECDQRCKHCYLFSEDARMACKSMTWNDMLHVLDSCYDFCDRVGRQPYFCITGGDLILHRDFWRLAQELHARGAMWCIMGNPFHLTDEACARMHALGCRKYQLSLDGATAATHGLFRKPGSFDETLRAAGCIKRSGMWLVLMSTVSSMNAAELPDMIDLAARVDAMCSRSGATVPRRASASRSATAASCVGGAVAARQWRRDTRATCTHPTRSAGWRLTSSWRICRGGVSPFGSARRGGFVCREPRGTLAERGRG